MNTTFGTTANKSAFLKIGTELDTPVTPTQARNLFFPWEVERRGLYTSDLDTVASHVAHIRNDTEDVIGVVGANSATLTNETFCDILEGTGLRVSAGGVDNNGGSLWMLLEMGRNDELFATDPHLRFLLARTSHDGSGALVTRPLTERLFCKNQFSSLRKAKGIPGEVTLRHTRHANNRVADAKKAIAKAYDAHAAMDRDILRMLDTNRYSLGGLITETFGARPTATVSDEGKVNDRKGINWDKRFEEIAAVFASDTCANIADSDYGKVMAINEWEINRDTKPGSATSARRVIAGLKATAKATNLVLA